MPLYTHIVEGFLANISYKKFPIDHNTTAKAIHWARMAAKEDTQTITILTINHTDWTTQTIPLNKHPDIHTITTIPPHNIHYNPTP